MQYTSTCYRKEEAVEMLKLFYDGVNPNAPNPKVKGVRVNKTTSDAMDSKRWWQPAIWRIKWKNVHIFLYNKWAWNNGWCKNRTIWPFLDKSFPTKSKSSVKVIFLNTTSSWSEFSMFSRNTHLDNGRHLIRVILVITVLALLWGYGSSSIHISVTGSHWTSCPPQGPIFRMIQMSYKKLTRVNN